MLRTFESVDRTQGVGRTIDCVFWGPKEGAVKLTESSVDSGIRFHIANHAEEARLLLALMPARVLLAHWNPQDPSGLAAIHGLTHYGREAVWIGWLPEFDSNQWLDCLEKGAFDLLTAEATGEVISTVIRQAEAAFARSGGLLRRRNRFRKLFSFGDLLIFRGR